MAEIKANVGVMSCPQCEKLNIAMQIMAALEWENAGALGTALAGYEKETQTILVSEQELMKLIRLANPYQSDRKLRLV